MEEFLMKHKSELLKRVGKNLLVSLPALIGTGLLLSTRGPLNPNAVSFDFFLAGFTGVIIAIRKESLVSIVSVRGKIPVIEGLIFTTVCWGIALIVLLFGI